MLGSVDVDTVVLVAKLGGAILSAVGNIAPLVFELFS